jgi:hypothetical protein
LCLSSYGIAWDELQLCHSTLKWYVTHTGGCGLSSGVGKNTLRFLI